jgi:hypothetical protein
MLGAAASEMGGNEVEQLTYPSDDEEKPRSGAWNRWRFAAVERAAAGGRRVGGAAGRVRSASPVLERRPPTSAAPR